MSPGQALTAGTIWMTLQGLQPRALNEAPESHSLFPHVVLASCGHQEWVGSVRSSAPCQGGLGSWGRHRRQWEVGERWRTYERGAWMGLQKMPAKQRWGRIC